jgi:hypothetical protein
MAKHETNLPFFIPGSPPFVSALQATPTETMRYDTERKNVNQAGSILVKFFP